MGLYDESTQWRVGVGAVSGKISKDLELSDQFQYLPFLNFSFIIYKRCENYEKTHVFVPV